MDHIQDIMCHGAGCYGSALTNTDFLQKYYGVSSHKAANTEEALKALSEGHCVLGSEEGHFLAFIPAPDEDKTDGCVFYILDSYRGHNGPFKSIEQATRYVREERTKAK